MSASATALPGPGSAHSPPVEHDEADRGDRQAGHERTASTAASMIAANESTSSDAPPTSAAVDVGQGEQLRRVVGLDAAAVEDPRALGLLAVAVGDQRADERDRVLGLLGRRRQPGADRPDRLVGDRDDAELLGLELLEAGLDLVAELALGVAALALLLGLADAQDRPQADPQRRRHLLGQRAVGLVEVLAALGVAEDDAVDADLLEHRAAHLAGERALGRLVHVLRVDLDARAARRVDHGLQRGERRAHRDLDALGARDARQQRLRRTPRPPRPSCASSSCPR